MTDTVSSFGADDVPSLHVRRRIASDVQERLARVVSLEQEILSLRTSIEQDLAYIAPHRILPPEILGEIFTLAANEENWRFPIIISRVSRRWRSIIYEYPRAWTLIPVGSRMTLPRLQFWLERSGTCRLTVYVNGISLEAEKLWPMVDALVPHAIRIRAMSMDVQFSVMERLLSEYSLDLPILQVLNIRDSSWGRVDGCHRTYGIITTFKVAPRLRFASIDRWIPAVDPHVDHFFHALTTLYLGFVTTTYPRVRQLLQCCPLLETLTLQVEYVLPRSSTGNEEAVTLIISTRS
ncbi:hypothetical protein JAAARDRAFT_596618 [Jaapia argillacea MUCL 33604]|uniref:F-box domain-containing protein n=1 Tax=Jaapia argillacea MUCL 33604 TaxID=933084 RepID=A0A067Q1T2_9AGAM|nr:hypothetical protein JAAARDRAFT_596618 [Jaapia argillacea MUCL 33604]